MTRTDKWLDTGHVQEIFLSALVLFICLVLGPLPVHCLGVIPSRAGGDAAVLGFEPHPPTGKAHATFFATSQSPVSRTKWPPAIWPCPVHHFMPTFHHSGPTQSPTPGSLPGIPAQQLQGEAPFCSVPLGALE